MDLLGREAVLKSVSYAIDVRTKTLEMLILEENDKAMLKRELDLLLKLKDDIENIPVMNIEIVPYYECRYYTFKPHPNSKNCYTQHCTRSAHVSTKPNDYCSLGKRRDKEEDDG